MNFSVKPLKYAVIYDILTRYINDNKGLQYITTEDLIKILEED